MTKLKQINMPYLDLEWTKHKTEQSAWERSYEAQN